MHSKRQSLPLRAYSLGREARTKNERRKRHRDEKRPGTRSHSKSVAEPRIAFKSSESQCSALTTSHTASSLPFLPRVLELVGVTPWKDLNWNDWGAAGGWVLRWCDCFLLRVYLWAAAFYICWSLEIWDLGSPEWEESMHCSLISMTITHGLHCYG